MFANRVRGTIMIADEHLHFDKFQIGICESQGHFHVSVAVANARDLSFTAAHQLRFLLRTAYTLRLRLRILLS